MRGDSSELPPTLRVWKIKSIFTFHTRWANMAFSILYNYSTYIIELTLSSIVYIILIREFIKIMKKIILIIVAISLATITLVLATKGVCMPIIFWLALVAPIAVIIVHLGGGKNLFK